MSERKFEPHLTVNPDGMWYVQMKSSQGEYIILSDPTPFKRFALRALRRIRREMAEGWLEKLSESRAVIPSEEFAPPVTHN